MTDLVRRRPWRGRDAAWLLLAGFAASVIAYAVVAPDPTTLELFALVFPAQWGGTLAALAIMAPRRAPWRAALRVEFRPADLWGLLYGAGVQIVLSLVAYWIIVELFDGSAPTQEVIDSASAAIGGLERAIVVFGLGVIGPITEELVFRGVLLRALDGRGRTGAILVSALVFAALHLLDPGAVVAVPFLFVLGLLLARRTLDTGRIGGAVAMHAGFNLVTIVAILSA